MHIVDDNDYTEHEDNDFNRSMMIVMLAIILMILTMEMMISSDSNYDDGMNDDDDRNDDNGVLKNLIDCSNVGGTKKL